MRFDDEYELGRVSSWIDFFSKQQVWDVINSVLKSEYDTNDCVKLDANIKSVKDFLGYLQNQKLSNYKFEPSKRPEILNKIISKLDQYLKDNYENENTIEVGQNLAVNLTAIVLTYVLVLERKFSELDCRNDIEVRRLNESAELISKQSATQEKNVLPTNYKEQYLYIGLGSIVLLVGLYVIAKK